jgi:hypothetical protein
MLSLARRQQILDDYARRIPRMPYATDDLREGVSEVRKAIARRSRYVQPNGKMIWCLVFDCDHDAAFCAAEDGLLPPPNIIVLNPDNGRGHLTYFLEAPVPRTDAARIKPLQYLDKIVRGMTRRLDADPGYSGLVTKNPLHPGWRTIVLHDHCYTLRELDEHLHPPNCRRPPRGEISGLGRNCTVFDELRHLAYRQVRDAKRNGETQQNFEAWAISTAASLNAQFPTPMSFSEVRSIGRSVSRWVWRRFDEETFCAIQTRRGRPGNAKRWNGHEPLSQSKPWEAQGISRSTYFRRKQRCR